MGILVESDSYIEIMLRNALIAEGIAFQEQYRIYSGVSFSEVVYVADFYLESQVTHLIVECDGREYHNGKQNKAKKLERDFWLTSNGYTVLHFTYRQLKYRMDMVISIIKNTLSDPHYTEPTEYKIQEINNRIKDGRQYEVIMYCYFTHTINKSILAYQFKYCKNNSFSDERIVSIDVNHTTNALAAMLYYALLDLKRPISILVNVGYLGNDKLGSKKEIFSGLKSLPHGRELLAAHTIEIKYINARRDSNLRFTESYKRIRRLCSRCKQIVNDENKHPLLNLVDHEAIISKPILFD